MNRPPKLLGLDIGFGFTKCDDGEQVVIFPSQVRRWDDGHDAEGRLPAGACRIALAGDRFVVGEDALGTPPLNAFARRPERLIGDFAKPLALAAAAQLSQQDDPLHMVVGLPVSCMQPWGPVLVENLAGHHLIQPEGGERGSDREVVHIHKLHVVPHPMGTYARLVTDQHGRPRSSAYRDAKIALVDIGFRTTDVVVVSGGRRGKRGNRTIEMGMADMFERIARRLLNRTDAIPGLDGLYRAIRMGFIHTGGREYHLETLRDEAGRRLAAALADQINHLLREDWDLDGVLLTGGAAPDLAEELAPRIAGDVILIEHERDARLNNAHGHLSLARRLWAAPEA